MKGGPIDWRDMFMTAGGRSSRGSTWVAVAVLFTLAMLYEAVAGQTLKLLTFWVIYPVLLAAAACVLSKRLHDRGRSGWWAAAVLFAFATLWPSPRGAGAVLALPVMLWAVVERGMMSGEQGANRFGPNPLGERVQP